MIWTDKLTKRALELRARGFSHSHIAREFGVTRNTVIGKLWRVDHGRPGSHIGRPITQTCDTWDLKTFEPYAEFKARKVMERMNGVDGR